MKKDRNSFFEQSSFYNQSTMQNPNMYMPNTPYTAGSYANQGFYAGPTNGFINDYNTNMPLNTNYNNHDYSDIESRLSKIERNINRLDARLTKLENSSFYTTEDMDTNNVYMM